MRAKFTFSIVPHELNNYKNETLTSTCVHKIVEDVLPPQHLLYFYDPAIFTPSLQHNREAIFTHTTVFYAAKAQ